MNFSILSARFFKGGTALNKKYRTFDARALKILKICVFVVTAGLLFTLLMYINEPTPEMKEICKQSLYACAFGVDIAVGGFLLLDYGFEKQKNRS